MEDLTPWKTIKIGFFFGIGFAVPLFLMEFATFGGAMMMATSSIEAESQFEPDLEGYSVEGSIPEMPEIPDFKDYSSEIELVEYSEKMQGNQLLITGELTNKSKAKIESIELEAELFDGAGNFVYECSEYISNEISPGKSENFLLKCGCSKNGLPEFERFELKIVSARRV